MPNSVFATLVDPARMRLEVRTEAGHGLVLDSSGEEDGAGAATPMEALLAALAGCTAMDVASILRKKRQRASSYEITVTGDRSDAVPSVYTRIVVEHRVRGAVEAEALRRSIELSATRYCPVNAMLSRATRIEHRWRLWPDGGDEQSGLVVSTGPAPDASA